MSKTFLQEKKLDLQRNQYWIMDMNAVQNKKFISKDKKIKKE